jgi:hypothetical protein
MLEVVVSELEEAWAVAIAEAEARARAAGRKDISEYLALRSANDVIRKIASDWLFTAFEIVADEANLKAAGIQISRDDEHRFKVGPATMTGRRLSLGKGVRLLVVEAGWPRTPRDGFIRGGGLACANIKHRGIRSASEQLRLVIGPGGPPRWILQKGPEPHPEIHEANIRDHIAILLDDSRTDSKHS